MKLGDQVCSMELAKRLKELGVKQESVFFWDTEVRWDRQTPYLRLNQFDAPTNDQVAAFTVAELLEQAEDFELWRSGDRYCVRADGSTVMMFTAADALAQMRIHQIERGLVKP